MVGPVRRFVRLINAGQLHEWLDDQMASGKESLRDDLQRFLNAQGIKFD